MLDNYIEAPSSKDEQKNAEVEKSKAEVMEIGQSNQCAKCGSNNEGRPLLEYYDDLICKRCRTKLQWSRGIAHILDDILVYLPLYFVFVLLASIWPEILGLLGLCGVFIGYMTKDAWLSGGRSPGKAICKICVVDRNSKKPISAAQSFKRNLPLLIPLVPLIAMFEIRKGQRTGDG